MADLVRNLDFNLKATSIEYLGNAILRFILHIVDFENVVLQILRISYVFTVDFEFKSR